MLDSAAQRQKVYLGYGKGLQNRRLPSHISSKVGDDYYQKRKSYDPKVLLDSKPPVETRGRSGTELTSTVPLQAERENISPEEKQKEVRKTLSCTSSLQCTCVHICVHIWKFFFVIIHLINLKHVHVKVYIHVVAYSTCTHFGQ